MKVRALCVLLSIPSVLGMCVLAQEMSKPGAPQKDRSRGYDDTPFLPGSKWRVDDIARPIPPVVAAGSESSQQRPGKPPSDAIVLFNGADLSSWMMSPKRCASCTVDPKGELLPVEWKVENGYVEVNPAMGNIITKQDFGDCQLHVEWLIPVDVKGEGQERANSGVYMMSRYEVQILDSYDNPTYADGEAAAIYGQYPPLVNVARKPGEWQSYDIVFDAPRFEGDKLVKPAYLTLFFNGVLVQNHSRIYGRMAHAKLPSYEPHRPREPLMLQNHGAAVRFRNIWIRPLEDSGQ